MPDVDDARLAALHRLAILDTEPEQVYEDAVALAAQICRTPMAAISLVDGDRQWFKAERGLGIRETPLAWSFCRHVAAGSADLQVGDATQDARFQDNPLVTGDPGIRFYAGAPLVVEDGQAVGALCVIDTVAGSLDDAQREALRILARQVAVLMQTRQAAQELTEVTAQRDAHARTAELAADRMRAVFDGVSTGGVMTGRDHLIVLANQALEVLTGASPALWTGRPYLDLIDPDARAAEHAVLTSMWRERTPSVVRETVVTDAHGAATVVLASSSLVCNPDGTTRCIVTWLESIADRRRAEIQLQEAQSAVDGIVTVDAHERIVSWNEGAARVLGHSRFAAVGKHLSMIIPKESRAGHARGFARLVAGAPPALLGKTVELEALHADGSHLPIELSLTRWYRGAEPFFTAVIRDISERRQSEAEQRWLSQHDPVSSLGNLNALREWWADRGPAAAARGDHVAVLSLHLPRLADVSAALGIPAVEILLAQLGSALRRASVEDLELFHLGDANFAGVVLLAGHADLRRRLETVARHTLQAAVGPFLVDDIPVQVDARIGIAGAPADDTTVDELLRRAEAARTSSSRRITVALDSDNGRQAITRQDLRLLADLHTAIDAQQLEVHYQPLSVRDIPVLARLGGHARPAAPGHRPHVVEALVRWQHPTLGTVAPGAFIPLAEHTSLITPLTRWVLAAALRQQRAWHQDGLDVKVAVNLSPEVLLNDDVIAMVRAALERTGCPPDRLKIEITESAIVAEPETARCTVRELRSMGVGVSLDDFGTGFTSLSLLRTLPLDEIKLDRTFVTNVTTNPADAAIATAVVDLAHRLGIEAVAEGVEDDATCRLLQELGYDLLQGYLFARPMPAEQVTRWLQARDDTCYAPAPDLSSGRVAARLTSAGVQA